MKIGDRVEFPREVVYDRIPPDATQRDLRKMRELGIKASIPAGETGTVCPPGQVLSGAAWVHLDGANRKVLCNKGWIRRVRAAKPTTEIPE